jgi:6-pyruvoyltetrahydropterin/6-carboxytetrahydropterin synthase
VRVCVNSPARAEPPPARHNTYAAWPPMRGLGRYYELRVTCLGEADPVTGYFINIRDIDQAVRDQALALLIEAIHRDGGDGPVGRLLERMILALQPPLRQTVIELRLDLTPLHSLAIRSADMTAVLIRQSYEFSAAHRLHADQLSDAENRRVFGKCNNPAGHGHNYRVEVVVRAPVDALGHVLAVEQLDAVVDQAVIQPLDHKHLNLDVPQFAGRNPSVENIVQVVFEMLAPAVRALGVSLEEVSVWETSKTVCTYRGKP